MDGEAEVVRNGEPGILQMALAKKLEGNPKHPISQGKLCVRGQAAIQATGLAPTDPRESAVLAVLTQGGYTAVVSGKNNTTGVALVEAYRVQ